MLYLVFSGGDRISPPICELSAVARPRPFRVLALVSPYLNVFSRLVFSLHTFRMYWIYTLHVAFSAPVHAFPLNFRIPGSSATFYCDHRSEKLGYFEKILKVIIAVSGVVY